MNAPSSQGLEVEVRGLRRDYHGRPALRNLNFRVNRGEVFVIMGPSGCGKTVLLKHLIGLERPDEGEVLIEGEPVLTPGLRDRRRLAMVFQSGALLNSLTVGENVGLYLSEHRLQPPAEIARRVAEKLELVGLAGTEAKLPSELSGGMKKRVSIARALIVEPHLMLYDEPTSELDPLSSVVIAEEILRLNQRIQATSVVVTHDRGLAFGIADRIALMRDGEIMAVGEPEAVRTTADPVLQRFLTADYQFRSTSFIP